MNKLNNKIALITGGDSGIGFATARKFLENGAQVLLTSYDEEGLEKAAMELGDGVHTFICDVRDLDQIDALKQFTEETFGGVDILFANAGIAKFAPFEEMPEELFDDTFAINVKGLYFTTQKLLPILNDQASIILMGSINAHTGMPGASVYAASKASVVCLAKNIGREVVDRGIRVNAISPGPVDTPIYHKLGFSGDEYSEFREGLEGQIPLQRFAQPEEIANSVLFFASEDSSFATGSELIVDGGMINF